MRSMFCKIEKDKFLELILRINEDEKMTKKNYSFKKMLMLTITLIILSSIVSTSLLAENKLSLKGSGEYFQLSGIKDGILLGSGFTLVGTDYLLEKVIKFGDKSWDGVLFNKDSINSLDKIFMRPYSKSIDLAGTITQAVCLVLPATLMVAPIGEWCTIGTMYFESAIFAYGLKDLGKALVYRPRPYMYFDSVPQEYIEDGDWKNSFPSGHTTMAFNGATFVSYVFCTYFPDSVWKIPVVAGSYALAVTTACLRIASGNHFLTDVLAGAVIGSATGFLVPFLHSRNLQAPETYNDGFSRTAQSNTSKGLSLSLIPGGVYGKISY